MFNKTVFHSISAVSLAVAVALAGCNGGGGSSSTSSSNNISGVITGFGSVYVNGVEFDTSSASYSVDGAPGSSDYDLDVGMRVTIEGTVNADGVTGSADAITYTDELEGVVLDVSGLLADGTGAMNIMGQEVTLTKLTIFKSDVSGIASPGDVVAGNIVEVSGHSDGKGNITASRIEVKAADLASYGSEIELKGVVASINPEAGTFMIGGLTVDYSGASLDDLPAEAGAWDGLYVEVKADSGPVDNGGGFTLAATVVELEDDGKMGVNAASGAEVELKGRIMSVSSPTEFMLDGQAVTIVAGNGEPEAGRITAVDESMIGRMAEAEGHMDANGILLAHEVELEDGDDGALDTLRDFVQSVDSDAGTVTLQGGEVIVVNSRTIMQDSISSNNEHYFDLSDLRSGDYLEIHVYPDGNGNLVAAKLEREDGVAI